MKSLTNLVASTKDGNQRFKVYYTSRLRALKSNKAEGIYPLRSIFVVALSSVQLIDFSTNYVVQCRSLALVREVENRS